MNIRIRLQVQHQPDQGGDRLSDHGRERRAGNAHRRTAEIPEDHDRVKDDIDDGARQLRSHALHGPPGRLQEPLKHHLEHQARGEPVHDPKVDLPHRGDLRVARLRADKRAGNEDPDQRKQHKIAEGQQQRHVGGLVRSLEFPFAERSREQGVHADAGTGTDRDHQVLQGKCERDGGQRIFRKLRDENAVHNVVECLHQHRDHHRQRHRDDQLLYGHDAHLVFLSVLHK